MSSQICGNIKFEIRLDSSVLPTMADSSIPALGEEIETLHISRPANTESSLRPRILRLPLELRRMIYRCVFRFTFTKRRGRGARDIIYSQNPGNRCRWADRPFPLFHVNKQIHGEICDFLPPIPTRIRITAQGMAFDTFGLASSAAQGFHPERDFGKLSHILVRIWPPHRDRPVEMLYIWNYARRLRDLLQKCESICKLTLQFEHKRPFYFDDNILLKVCRRIFGFDTQSTVIPGRDIDTVLKLFAVLTNVKDAQVTLPGSESKSDDPFGLPIKIEQIMMGIRKPDDGPSEVENYNYKVIEKFLNQGCTCVSRILWRCVGNMCLSTFYYNGFLRETN
ncbi:MAG: hypothetical protein Q9226_002239 [Calogaya cf. arnoldii]